MIGRLVNQALKREPPEYPWGDALPILKGADCRICNLECVISSLGSPWAMTPKAFHFRSDAKNVAVLTAAGIDAVSLANNHTLDFEYEAMFEMIALLDRAGIRHAGAGANLGEASRPARLEVGGVPIGLIAFTDNEPRWAATEDEPGIFYVPIDLGDTRTIELLDGVRQAKGEVDLLIVSAHWGPNWGYTPPPEHRSLARALVEAGADVVFGHSCHVVRGIELYRGRPVLYGTGDFVDDYAVDEIERNDRSLIFGAEVERGQITRLILYPTVIRRYQAQLAKGGEAKVIADTMERFCADLGTVARWDEREGGLEIPVG